MAKPLDEIAKAFLPKNHWRNVPVTAGMLVHALGPSNNDPMGMRYEALREMIERAARQKTGE